MKSVLVILFNQDYSKNIPKLEKIYSHRFNKIIYLVPSHNSRLHDLYINEYSPQWFTFLLDKSWNYLRDILGKKNPNGIDITDKLILSDKFQRVIGHQFFFYHFISQSAKKLLEYDTDWYWIVGDDALINPRINDSNIQTELGLSSDTDSVICQPVIGADKWISQISESVPKARSRLKNALGAFPPYSNLKIDQEDGAKQNTDIAVATSDFFGISKELLIRLIDLWQQCFNQKIYVEIAVPNSILSISKKPLFITNYFWKRQNNPEEWKNIINSLHDKSCIFAHPVKLSAVSLTELDKLYSE